MRMEWMTPNANAISARFEIDDAVWKPSERVKVGRGERLGCVVQTRAGLRVLAGFKWGMVPAWFDQNVEDRRLFWARAETLESKRAFAPSFDARRCIVPAAGFWLRVPIGEREIDLLVRPRDTCPERAPDFGVAALWDKWIDANGAPLRSCALVSTPANQVLETISARWPAMVRAGDEADWLDCLRSLQGDSLRVLRPLSMRELRIDVVSNAPQSLESIEIDADSSAILTQIFGHDPNEKAARPAPKKRVVRRDWVSPDGQIFFHTRSWTREDWTRWHPVIDAREGHVWCDCPDFRYRHAKHEPDVRTPQWWCKHVARAVDNCRRHGELQR